MNRGESGARQWSRRRQPVVFELLAKHRLLDLAGRGVGDFLPRYRDKACSGARARGSRTKRCRSLERLFLADRPNGGAHAIVSQDKRARRKLHWFTNSARISANCGQDQPHQASCARCRATTPADEEIRGPAAAQFRCRCVQPATGLRHDRLRLVLVDRDRFLGKPCFLGKSWRLRIATHENRASEKREISWAVAPVVARSARISPIIGANLKPWPEQGDATIICG
jgi:hypothetical protein